MGYHPKFKMRDELNMEFSFNIIKELSWDNNDLVIKFLDSCGRAASLTIPGDIIIKIYNFLSPEKVVKVEDIKEAKERAEKDTHLKGYMFDSLVYRYQLAREEMMECEIRNGSNYSSATTTRDRDVRKFIQILNELTGEHD